MTYGIWLLWYGDLTIDVHNTWREKSDGFTLAGSSADKIGWFIWKGLARDLGNLPDKYI